MVLRCMRVCGCVAVWMRGCVDVWMFGAGDTARHSSHDVALLPRADKGMLLLDRLLCDPAMLSEPRFFATGFLAQPNRIGAVNRR